jgi:hypothetical protein
MYMRDGEETPAPLDRSPLGVAALALSIAGVLLLGIFPEPILILLRDSAAALF